MNPVNPWGIALMLISAATVFLAGRISNKIHLSATLIKFVAMVLCVVGAFIAIVCQ